MWVAQELAYIIKPLVGQSPHHLKNTQNFIQQLQNQRLEPREVTTSFDVKDLFTSVPVAPSIKLSKQKLQQDPTLPQRTNMSIQQIITLQEFCLTNTYFLFQGEYFEQIQGAAMGSPTFVINKAEHSQSLLHHINNQDPNIQFTVEEPTQPKHTTTLGHPGHHRT